jgi:hypothetical protein
MGMEFKYTDKNISLSFSRSSTFFSAKSVFHFLFYSVSSYPPSLFLIFHHFYNLLFFLSSLFVLFLNSSLSSFSLSHCPVFLFTSAHSCSCFSLFIFFFNLFLYMFSSPPPLSPSCSFLHPSLSLLVFCPLFTCLFILVYYLVFIFAYQQNCKLSTE